MDFQVHKFFRFEAEEISKLRTSCKWLCLTTYISHTSWKKDVFSLQDRNCCRREKSCYLSEKKIHTVRNHEIVIKVADKRKEIVILKWKDYINEADKKLWDCPPQQILKRCYNSLLLVVVIVYTQTVILKTEKKKKRVYAEEPWASCCPL